MTLLQIKAKLQKLIDSNDNAEVLQEICFFLERQDKGSAYPMNAEQISAAEEAREQIKKGNFMNHNEAMERLSQWKSKSSGLWN